MTSSDVALVVWELPAAVVRLANEAAATLFGTPLDELPGTRAIDLVEPPDAVEEGFAALNASVVDHVRAHRQIRSASGSSVPITVWSRAIELDGARAAVSLLAPTAEVGRLGRDPTAPWRDISPVAIGTAHRDWTIETMSSEIAEILGMTPRRLGGATLLDLVHPDDASKVFRKVGDVAVPRSHCRIRLRRPDGSWISACVLIAPLPRDPSGRVAFALIGMSDKSTTSAPDRVVELERHLRHIGAEVRAAGVLDEVGEMPAAVEHPKLAELTSRQWHIVSRLLQGDRVPTIAAALFVSQSTVRNHLANIFTKFGVHSQAALLAELRRTRRPHAKEPPA